MSGYALQQQFQKSAQAAEEKQQQAATELARVWLSMADKTPEQRRNFYNTFVRLKTAGVPAATH